MTPIAFGMAAYMLILARRESDLTKPDELLVAYMAYIQQKNYGEMYRMIDVGASQISEEDFKKRNFAISFVPVKTLRKVKEIERTALNEDENKPLYNCFRQVWCPGSVLKPVTAAIGLESGAVDPNEDYGNAGLRWQKDASWGSCYVTTLRAYEPVVLENALIYSDNIYTAFCNGSNVIKPYLVYREEVKAEYWIPNAFSENTTSLVLGGIKKVINDLDGTGYAAHREDILLAGKTGTAEIKASKDDTSGTELGWFAVFTAEYEQENLILIVSMVEDVKGRGGSGYVVKKDKQVLDSWFDRNQ